MKRQLTILQAPIDADCVMWRDPSGEAEANVPWTVVSHSPDGYEWGYGGSGPADLALNILNAFVPPGRPINWSVAAEQLDAELDRDDAPEKCYRGTASRFACRYHHAFKDRFVARLPREGGTISAAVVRRFIEECREQERAQRAQGGAS